MSHTFFTTTLWTTYNRFRRNCFNCHKFRLSWPRFNCIGYW